MVCRRSGQAAFLALAVVTMLAFDAAAAGGEQQTGPTISGDDLVRRAAAGEPISLRSVTVEGDVDLRPAVRVTGLFRCQSCQFTGAVRATEVVFENIVDVRGSITGDRDSKVAGDLDLTGATFHERARFDGTTVAGAAQLSGARFLRGLSVRGTSIGGAFDFDNGEVAGHGLFAESTFLGGATFTGSTFDGDASFFRATFGRCTVDPRGAPCPADKGVGEAVFQGAIFRGSANFVLSSFYGRADFDGMELGGSAAFTGADFRYEAPPVQTGAGPKDQVDEVILDNLHSVGGVDFRGATFEDDVRFYQFVSFGPVSLEGIVAKGGDLRIEPNFSVARLSMDVEAVRFVRGAKVRVLALIEHSAQDRKDLAVANDARYELLSLQGATRRGLHGFLDRVFYRGVGGYLVRPFRSVLAFVALLTIGTIVRTVHRLASACRPSLVSAAPEFAADSSSPAEVRRSRVSGQRVLAALFAGLAATLGIAFHAKPTPRIEVGDEERVVAHMIAAARWVEFLAYKVLIVVFILAIGNSSLTVRQIIDSVRR